MQVVNGKVDGFVGKDKIYIGRATKKLPRSPLAINTSSDLMAIENK